ncbi:MAG: metal-dependent hydrolase [Desulfomonile tiedjei]|uniref:Metal-dependent hydrolase n=1 Tax=Desulfomonile tiedjei TaxID=2358 RepID=A0A9D6Z2K2_9BACT|nr:metal-dependent hydrolase [Desulfomonile tiedjei]
MILGHFALASLAKQSCFHKDNWILLVVASIMPDLMDKPANIFLGLPGRGVGHSLIVLVAVAVFAWLLCSRLKINTDFLFPGVVMWLSHLAGDFVKPEVFFWPFLGQLEPSPRFDFWQKLYQFYIARVYPEQFWLEAFCVAAALSLWAFRSGIPRLVVASLARQEANRNRGIWKPRG